jgi:hypothetical protein
LVEPLDKALQPGHGDYGPDRLMKRCIIALGSMGARIEEISTVTDLPIETLRRDFTEDLELGQILRRCVLIANIDAAASGRNRRTPSVPAMIYLMRRMDEAEGRVRPRRRR